MESKETILKDLTPIEKLFVISYEVSEVYTKKNKLTCVLGNFQSLGLINAKGKVNLNKDVELKPYEHEMLSLLENKDYVKFNEFIENNLVFNRTLVRFGLLKERIDEKQYFKIIKVPKMCLVKTAIYHSVLSELINVEYGDSNVLFNHLIGDKYSALKTKVCYDFVVDKIKNAYRVLEEKKQ